MSNKTRKEMLSAVRAYCARAGAVWMRENIMERHGVRSLADLPDHALAAAYVLTFEPSPA